MSGSVFFLNWTALLSSARWKGRSHVFNEIFSHNVVEAGFKLRILSSVFLSPVYKHLEATLSSEVIT